MLVIDTVRCSAASDNQEREHARKHIAPAFSSSNLQHTCSCLNSNISNTFRIFDQKHAAGQILDAKELVLSLFIGTLTKSSFGVEFAFHSDGNLADTDTDVINGEEFLKEMEIAVKERAMQAVIPFR